MHGESKDLNESTSLSDVKVKSSVRMRTKNLKTKLAQAAH